MTIVSRLVLGSALGAALLVPAIANATTPFVATSSCTLPNSSAPSLNCTSTFAVPARNTWQLNFLSYYCTSNAVPTILTIQFTTHGVNGESYFSSRANIVDIPPTGEAVTFGTVNPLSIYADPRSTISVVLQIFGGTTGPISNTVCNLTLGGLVVDE
jgi:hypothetical protein